MKGSLAYRFTVAGDGDRVDDHEPVDDLDGIDGRDTGLEVDDDDGDENGAGVALPVQVHSVCRRTL